MDLKVPLFKQTTKFTCSPASVLMILEHFGILKANRINEMKILELTRGKPFKLETDVGIASALMKFGFGCKIISKQDVKIGEIGLCFEYESIDISKKSLLFKKFLKNRNSVKMEALRKGCIIEDRNPTSEDVIEILNKKMPAILLFDDFFIDSEDNRFHCPHTVAVVGFSRGNFKINDPWQGKIKVSKSLLDKSIKSLEKNLGMRPALIEPILIGKRN